MGKLRKCFIFLSTIVAFSSCINAIPGEEETTNEQSKNVTIKVKNITQTDFTRADVSAAKRISYVLFTDGAKTQEIEQTNEDANFGTLTINVPYGSHTLSIVAHNGTTTANVVSASAVTFGERITDTFCNYQNLEVNKSSSTTLNTTLDRSVAKFELVATDAIPNGIVSLVFECSGGGNVLNTTTGLAVSNATQAKNITVPASMIGSAGITFSLYTFLASDECNMNISAKALNADGDVMFSESWQEVPMKVNRISRYTGSFFKVSSNMTGDITINNTWLDDYEAEF